ncbi:hypothetical protein BGZ60DRAFT_532309 [Tricladium varicosporioides]|nr:hypothetical protein BGZ60DRAFT_532309 [Hymenoscyphus varicosporioides]
MRNIKGIRAAKDPDKIWRYNHKSLSTDTSKGKGKAKDYTEKSKSNEKEKDLAGSSDTSKRLLVKTIKAKKRKGVYYFTNEEGNDVETKEND